MLCGEINPEALQDLINIENGLLEPLRGFMGRKDYRSVVKEMKLSDGSVWTLPISLDVDKETYRTAGREGKITLKSQGSDVAILNVADAFEISDEDIFEVYKTLDENHPGVMKERERGPYRLGGIFEILSPAILNDNLKAEDTKAAFARQGWQTIAGFQTRNPVHRAHEHLQRVALEICDGLFINPIVGWKKTGDFTEEAVRAGYARMIREFYPASRIYFDGLRTQMRYAGPREAIFHAIIRRNLGCTHFIIGRDHAGVGSYYGTYEAHELAATLAAKNDLGVELLLLREPYWCDKCGQIVTDKTCAHSETDKLEISGTAIRKCLTGGQRPDPRMMRPEVADSIIGIGGKIFID